jgi:hypothetical protein
MKTIERGSSKTCGKVVIKKGYQNTKWHHDIEHNGTHYNSNHRKRQHFNSYKMAS